MVSTCTQPSSKVGLLDWYVWHGQYFSPNSMWPPQCPLSTPLTTHCTQDAMDELNGRSYDGRDLRIRMDEGRPRRDDGGGRGYGGRGGGDRGRRDERRYSDDDRDRRGGGRRRSRSRSASRSRSRSRGDRSSRRSPSPRRSRSPKDRGDSGSPPSRREEKRSRSRTISSCLVLTHQCTSCNVFFYNIVQ